MKILELVKENVFRRLARTTKNKLHLFVLATHKFSACGCSTERRGAKRRRGCHRELGESSARELDTAKCAESDRGAGI